MKIDRWSGAKGRCNAVAHFGLVWTVSNALNQAASFEDQTRETFDLLDKNLAKAGSAKTHVLSVQVMLADLENKPAFDTLWEEWIGPNPDHWPQRACFQAGLTGGLLVELVAVAAQIEPSE